MGLNLFQGHGGYDIYTVEDLCYVSDMGKEKKKKISILFVYISFVYSCFNFFNVGNGLIQKLEQPRFVHCRSWLFVI